MNVYFKEEQKFSQWWLWLIMIGIAIIPILAIYQQLILGEPFGDNPMPDFALVIFAVLVFGLIALLWSFQLKTHIDHREIRIQFAPFVKKQLYLKDIKSAQVIKYGFVGGWGIRLGTKYGTVYNTSGNMGLALELHNGKKYLIGTQKEQDLKRVLERAKNQGLLN